MTGVGLSEQPPSTSASVQNGAETKLLYLELCVFGNRFIFNACEQTQHPIFLLLQRNRGEPMGPSPSGWEEGHPLFELLPLPQPWI